MTLGGNIKKRRKEFKLSQKKLGELIGKSESSVKQYEMGRTEPPLSVLDKISDVLKISTSELIAGQSLSTDKNDIMMDIIKKTEEQSEIVDNERECIRNLLFMPQMIKYLNIVTWNCSEEEINEYIDTVLIALEVKTRMIKKKKSRERDNAKEKE